MDIFKIIKEGTKAVPATKFAMGIAGMVAVVALIVSLNIDFRVAIWGTIILLGLMIVLVVFAKLTQTAAEDFRTPVKILMWAFVLIFISICIFLTTSVFFRFPVNLQYFISEKPKEKPSTSLTTSQDSIIVVSERPVFNHSFAVNYMRLFGVFGTTRLMDIMASKGIVKSKPGPNNGYHIKGHEEEFNSELADFWINKWDYKDAAVLRTDLWEQISNDPNKGENIYWTALSHNMVDFIAFASSWYSGEGSNWEETDDIPEKLKKEAIQFTESFDRRERLRLSMDGKTISDLGVQESDIGFIFLILTNSNSQDVFDVEIQTGIIENPLKIQKLDVSTFKTKPDPKTIALKEDSKTFKKVSVLDTLKLASIKAGKSVVWLLGIYKKKPNGLPEYYLTNLYIPQMIQFRYGSQQFYDTIRKPYGTKALKMNVPNGWIGQ